MCKQLGQGCYWQGRDANPGPLAVGPPSAGSLTTTPLSLIEHITVSYNCSSCAMDIIKVPGTHRRQGKKG